MPSAVGHLLQGKSDAGIDSLGVHARGQHGISEIHGFRLPTYEQNARNLTLPLCGFSALLPNSLAPSPGFLIACQWFRFTPRGKRRLMSAERSSLPAYDGVKAYRGGE